MHQLGNKEEKRDTFLRIRNFSNYCNPLKVRVYNAEDAFLAPPIGR